MKKQTGQVNCDRLNKWTEGTAYYQETGMEAHRTDN